MCHQCQAIIAGWSSGAYILKCQMTTDCTTATTRRTNTPVTATPATAEVGAH